MGTPEFAVTSLDTMIKNGFNIVSVVTNPDKPAGRGKKIRYSPVKKHALQHDIPVLQPKNLKSTEFIDQLQELEPDLIVVVAFRMLPKAVWSIPKKGTINLHASLLPDYRGAAPINWALINGEKETGVSTFFIEEKMDTGNVIDRERVKVEDEDTAETLHDKLKDTGASLLVKTLESIKDSAYKPIPQNKLEDDVSAVHTAPKIDKADCKINWNQDTNTVYNFIRGLSPHPGAWTQIKNTDNDTTKTLKILFAWPRYENHTEAPGTLKSDNKQYISIATNNGWLDIQILQAEGRKSMATEEYLKGTDMSSWVILNNT